jgi:hypothetical protein
LYSQIIISGRKVQEDDATRWFVFCYICAKAVSANFIDSDDTALNSALVEHRQAHTENKENH